jgi:hypothetical protein
LLFLRQRERLTNSLCFIGIVFPPAVFDPQSLRMDCAALRASEAGMKSGRNYDKFSCSLVQKQTLSPTKTQPTRPTTKILGVIRQAASWLLAISQPLIRCQDRNRRRLVIFRSDKPDQLPTFLITRGEGDNLESSLDQTSFLGGVLLAAYAPDLIVFSL